MIQQRKALGKGLGSLIPVQPTEEIKKTTNELPIELIHPNKFQPRKDFQKKNLDSLAQSIKEKGIVQPIIVRKSNAGYELIAGERRWRAAQLAGMRKVPVIIKETNDAESLEIALIENIQREDLNPLEEAEAYQMLMDEFKLTQEDVSRRVSKDRSTIANFLRILTLPEYIKEDIANKRLTMGHARALLGVESASYQQILRDQIINKGLSVREVEGLIKNIKKFKKTDKTEVTDIFQAKTEDDLQKKIGTRVRIKKGKKGGKVEIYFYSEEELERIIDLF